MFFRISISLLLLILVPLSPALAHEKKLAEWTFMVFMNGDNNLEEFAMNDFEEMAKVGSTDDVNVVVQIDRTDAYDSSYGDWTGTLRFRVAKDMTPTPDEAVQNLGEVNMGDGAALRAFVEWARAAYPAKRYALVIWNHGQGWKFRLATNISAVRKAERDALATFVAKREKAVAAVDAKKRSLPVFASNQIVPGSLRSVSDDDSSNDTLYNRELEESLRPILVDQPLDLIGYDACLMAMIETVYSVRELAKVMVASEELEPGAGWNYELVVDKLVRSPGMDARKLGQSIVEAYEKNYGPSGVNDETTTLSAIDLAQAPRLAVYTSALADKLAAFVAANAGQLQNIRGFYEIAYGYIQGYELEYSVDLDLLAEKLIAQSNDQNVIRAAQDLRAAIREAVIANYAGQLARKERGSRGIAIYFPPTGYYFWTVDPDYRGYLESNRSYPVEFVQHHLWDNFLVSSYFHDAPGP